MYGTIIAAAARSWCDYIDGPSAGRLGLNSPQQGEPFPVEGSSVRPERRPSVTIFALEVAHVAVGCCKYLDWGDYIAASCPGITVEI